MFRSRASSTDQADQIRKHHQDRAVTDTMPPKETVDSAGEDRKASPISVSAATRFASAEERAASTATADSGAEESSADGEPLETELNAPSLQLTPW